MPRIIWKLLSISAFVAFMLALQGCAGSGAGLLAGSGQVETERQPTAGVTGVNYDAPGKLTVTLGDKEELVIKGDDNIIPLFEIEIVSDTLSIFLSEETSFSSEKPIEFNLTVKEMGAVELRGSGDVSVPDLTSDRLDLTVTGSGDLRSGALEADTVEVEIEGPGKIKIGDITADLVKLFTRASGGVNIGKVEARALEIVIVQSGDIKIGGGKVFGQWLSIDGSGDYTAKSLRSTNAKVDLSGSSNVTLRTKDNLLVKMIGDGDLFYYGSPKVDKRKTGSGKIKKLD